MIYLDNNATTAIDPQVLAAIHAAWQSGPLNPSSQHAAGRHARQLLDDACLRIGRLLGTDLGRSGGARLIITSGGSEANQWLLQQWVDSDRPRLIGATEHPSVLAPCDALASAGTPVRRIAVDAEGRLDLTDLQDALVAAEKPGLVSVMLANNETGTLQPLEAIVPIAKRYGFLVHTDATQWIGKLPFDFDQLGIDAATFAAHKLHGPVGVGGLLIAPQQTLKPLIAGGQQQLGSRAGTEPVALVVGMAQALEIAHQAMPASTAHMTQLRETFETRLCQAIPSAVIHGHSAPRLPSTTSISFPGIDRQTMLILLDRAGIACGSGSACASGSSQPSHVLEAMRVPTELIESAIRFGVSRLSTTSEIELASERIISVYNKLSSN